VPVVILFLLGVPNLMATSSQPAIRDLEACSPGNGIMADLSLLPTLLIFMASWFWFGLRVRIRGNA